MNLGKLEQFILDNKLPAFRCQQIKKAIYQDGVLDFNDITTLAKELRVKLAGEIGILSFKVEKVLKAKDKKTVKALLKLNDGNFIETVIMGMAPGHWTACISSQAGCPVGCAFCASGSRGLFRNLTAEEISDQVLFWLGYIKTNKLAEDLNNVVYMGMGEPFLNWPEVKESLNILMDKELFNFGARSISISTVGIPEGIGKLAREFPQVNLAVSLHSADNKIRSQLVPINNVCNLFELKKALERYLAKTNRKIFIEYIMLADINDDEDAARELAEYIKEFNKHYLLHVNLVTYNKTTNEFRPSGKASEFRNYLLKNKIHATIRKSFGGDIMAACGQLAGKK